MQQLVSQVALPVVLALIMLSMGLGLTVKNFTDVFRHPLIAVLGLGLQMLLLPVLALLLIAVFDLSPIAAAGLFLLSLCPGGATSNLFSYLARGNVALSISLTAITSLLVPFSLPLLFVAYVQWVGDEQMMFAMPLDIMIKQLVAVTLVPVLVGMLIRHFAANWAVSVEPLTKRIATVAMIAVIILLIATNLSLVINMASVNGMAVLALSCIALVLAYQVSLGVGVAVREARTLAMETGIQNAGTAMMVALTLLEQPSLAIIPLMYGLLMNIPAFGFIAWVNRKGQSGAMAGNRQNS